MADFRGYRVAQTPDSWGVEDPSAPTVAPPELFLDQVAAAGYVGVELGPLGYLPRGVHELRAALESRELALIGGWVMQPWSDLDAWNAIEQTGRETFALLAGGGSELVVLIDAMTPERIRVAGRPEAARLSAIGRQTMMDAVHRAARIATAEFGLRPVFHPHVGTFVEFEDEIAWFLEHSDPELIGLCVDTGHAVYAGVDPVTLCRRYSERVEYVHVKDVDPNKLQLLLSSGGTFDDAVSSGVFCPLGDGVVDFKGLAVALRELDYAGWLGVEQDRLPQAPTDPRPLKDAVASLSFLRDIGLASHGAGPTAG